MAKMLIVAAFEADPDDPAQMQEIMQELKPVLEKKPGLQLYGASQETADAIIGFLQDGLPEPVEP